MTLAALHAFLQRLRHAVATQWGRLPRRLRLLCGISLSVPLLVGGATRLFQHHLITLTGLPAPKRTIVIQELSLPEFDDRMRHLRTASETPNVRCRRLGLHALGLVQTLEPPIESAINDTTMSLTGALGGRPLVSAYYAGGTDTIFAVDPSTPTVLHEWIHAVDDQYSQRIHDAATVRSTDEGMALRAAIEGTAMVALHSTPVISPLTTDLDANSWILAYGFGPQYVYAISDDTISHAFHLAPRTSYEVLFHHQTTTIPIPTARARPMERRLCIDQIGALGVLSALRRARLDVTAAHTIAHAWRGDRMEVFATPDAHRVTWTVAFADSATAREWQRRVVPQLQLHSVDPTDLRVIVGASVHSSPFDRLGQ